jgi:hypothetical protein
MITQSSGQPAKFGPRVLNSVWVGATSTAATPPRGGNRAPNPRGTLRAWNSSGAVGDAILTTHNQALHTPTNVHSMPNRGHVQ